LQVSADPAALRLDTHVFQPGILQSFFPDGFEGSTHRRREG
jgi:hypothetical protein